MAFITLVYRYIFYSRLSLNNKFEQVINDWYKDKLVWVKLESKYSPFVQLKLLNFHPFCVIKLYTNWWMTEANSFQNCYCLWYLGPSDCCANRLASVHRIKERKSGIAPTWIINEKELDLTAGMVLTVNWDRDTLCVWNFHHKNVYFAVFTVPFIQSHYYSSFTCQLCSVTHCRNDCMTKCFFINTKQQETRANIMIFVSLWQEEI